MPQHSPALSFHPKIRYSAPNLPLQYALLNGADGLAKLAALSGSAATLPITRAFLGFLTPTMVYVPGSKNISLVGLQLSDAPDGGFAVLKAAIASLQAGGVSVLLSVGGWDFNCFPYAYTRYSVAGCELWQRARERGPLFFHALFLPLHCSQTGPPLPTTGRFRSTAAAT